MEIQNSNSNQNPTYIDRLLSPEIIPPVTELGVIATAGATTVLSYKKFYVDHFISGTGMSNDL